MSYMKESVNHFIKPKKRNPRTIIDLTKDVKQQNLYVLGETGVLEVSFDEGKKRKRSYFI